MLVSSSKKYSAIFREHGFYLQVNSAKSISISISQPGGQKRKNKVLYFLQLQKIENKAFVGLGSCDNVQTERSIFEYANWPRLQVKRTGPSSWFVQLVRPADPSSWSVQLVWLADQFTHCILHVASYMLYPKCCILHVASYTLHRTHIASYKLHITHCIFHIASYTLHLTHCILLIAFYNLHLRHWTLHCINLLNLCFRNLWMI